MKEIYLDNSATTKVSKEVLKSMLPYFCEIYGNSNSLHAFGLKANKGVEKSRQQIAAAINASPNEIYFTSGGTEANNWAIKGIAEGNKHKGKHIIVSAIEHHSVMDSARYLQDLGYEVDFAEVNQEGFIDLKKLEKLIRPDTILVSVMLVNNEVGSIQPIEEIRNLLNSLKSKAYFHVDAVQGISTIKIDVKTLGVDLLTISSHKIHGPKGIGALYMKKGVKINRFVNGGEQEFGMRGGTSNVPAIVGFGKAVEINEINREKNVKILDSISSYFISEIQKQIPYLCFNSPQNNRSPQIVNISFDLIEGESILLWLNKNNIAVSTGSACASNSLNKSHVLSAMGRPHQLINAAVRFSFNPEITKKQVDYVVKTLVEVVSKLRTMSPLKEKDVCIMKK